MPRIRSAFSFRIATGDLRAVLTASRLANPKAKAKSLSDRCSTYGFNAWSKLCAAEKIKPVFGVEIGCAPELGGKASQDFWSFFAIETLEPLHRLVEMATANPGKSPVLTYKQALSVPGVVVMIGENARFDALPAKLPKNTYVALSPATCKGSYLAAKKRKIKFILTSANLYPTKADREFYRYHHGGFEGRGLNTQSYPQHIASDAEIAKSIDWFTSKADVTTAAKNRDAVLSLCKAKLEPATMIQPERPTTLRSMCLAGAKRLGVNVKRPVYKARLDRELKLIADKNFEDYFYVIADLVQFAKTKMIVGPARGSSCGSLVCYLLGITTVDPIPYDLIFERFIDINRKDLPDIDIDFSDTQRHLVLDYAVQKYGAHRVARLGTVGMLRGRSALRAAGSALGLSIYHAGLAALQDALPDRDQGDLRPVIQEALDGTPQGAAMLEAFPALALAPKLEGLPSNASQHAAGIVITEHPIRRYVALDSRTGSVMCDKRDAEELNLLKIDALGLTQLSVFERCLSLIRVPADGDHMNSFLGAIPLNDPAAFAILNDGKFSGVFQFAGQALQGITRQIKITSIEDMITITALARPGPMGSGSTDAWVKRKLKKEKLTFAHALVKPIFENTLGVMVYQEQLMRVAREVGGMSWEDVSKLRKAMAKSMGRVAFEAYEGPFMTGAKANGVPAHTAEKLWSDMCANGSYAFNRSHSVAYGIISYWCCWLKAHHPVAFAAATLDAEAEPANQIKLLRELSHEGVDYVPVDPERSSGRWEVIEEDGKQKLLGPLTTIKGVGGATVNEIITARAKQMDLRPTLKKKLENARTSIDSLFPIRDVLDNLDLSAYNIVTKPRKIGDIKAGSEDDVLIIGVAKSITLRDLNSKDAIEKRKGKPYTDAHLALNMWLVDDEHEIFCQIGRYDFNSLSPYVIEAKAGRSILAIKGTVARGDFRMVRVNRIKYLGDMP